MRAMAALALLTGLLLTACGDSRDDATEAAQATTTPSVPSQATIASTTPTTTPPTTTTEAPAAETTAPTTAPAVELDLTTVEAIEVATRFMEAFANHDMDTITESAIEGHVFGLVAVNFDRYPDEFAWRDAVGWEIKIDECTPSYVGTSYVKITCSVTHDSTWGRALGTGPYDGEYYVRVDLPGGENEFDRPTVTQRTHAQFPTSTFGLETLTPFLEWVANEHPGDLDAMRFPIPPGDLDILPQLPLLTPESIELWQRHTEEFITASD